MPYTVHPVNIGKDEQFRPQFIAINPNSKIPAIVDREGPEGKPYALFESGAILLYLAEKTGKLLPQDGRCPLPGRAVADVSDGRGRTDLRSGASFRARGQGAGPVCDRSLYERDAAPLFGVLERRLGKSEYLAGDYSVADIATFPWVARHEWHRTDLDAFPHVKRWFDAIGKRPAVVKGMQVPS